ncbi:hypothetical protein HYY72_05900 [Candidatus Woesearchaeota archaeon]|nr:hypothetical protein [Candidatus Woesearchaeota archaeon]
MENPDYGFLIDEEEDEETLDELKKANKARSRSFSSVINKKKLSKYELDEVMA